VFRNPNVSEACGCGESVKFDAAEAAPWSRAADQKLPFKPEWLPCSLGQCGLALWAHRFGRCLIPLSAFRTINDRVDLPPGLLSLW